MSPLTEAQRDDVVYALKRYRGLIYSTARAYVSGMSAKEANQIALAGVVFSAARGYDVRRSSCVKWATVTALRDETRTATRSEVEGDPAKGSLKSVTSTPWDSESISHELRLAVLSAMRLLKSVQYMSTKARFYHGVPWGGLGIATGKSQSTAERSVRVGMGNLAKILGRWRDGEYVLGGIGGTGIVVDGEFVSVAEAAKRANKPRSVIMARMRQGHTADRVLRRK